MKSAVGSACANQVVLRPIDALNPSSYNPRQADPQRLALVETSLRKLGWLLPIYASPEGEILSGHQRHHIARKMGLRQVPVCISRPMDLEERKAINLVFNRGTNDLEPWENPKDLNEALKRSGADRLAEKLTDKKPTDYDFFRCLFNEAVPISRLLRANSGRWKQHAANVSRTLHLRGIVMPLVCTADLRVINGIGRLQTLAEHKAASAAVVYIEPEEVPFASAMLNLLSMDFDLHNRYQDLLRYNSFRRARRVRRELGRGMVFAVVGRKSAVTFDILQPDHRAAWTAVHGSSVLDFGAGHLHETNLLQDAGIDVTPFEPYRIRQDSNEIDKAESLALARAFLRAVADGKQWSSIFISSVLNSVPFEADRRHIVRICAALCGPETRVYAVASGTDQSDWLSSNGSQYLNRKSNRSISFALNYEPGIKLGELGSTPKVQKYHTTDEFRRLFAPFFSIVNIRSSVKNVEAIAARARAVPADALAESLRFEFDLPYPDGTRMGMVSEAIAAFSKRGKVRP